MNRNHPFTHFSDSVTVATIIPLWITGFILLEALAGGRSWGPPRFQPPFTASNAAVEGCERHQTSAKRSISPLKSHLDKVTAHGATHFS